MNEKERGLRILNNGEARRFALVVAILTGANSKLLGSTPEMRAEMAVNAVDLANRAEAIFAAVEPEEA